MESRGRTDCDRRVLLEKMFSDFCNVGSAKDGDAIRLWGGVPAVVRQVLTRGGKSESVKRCWMDSSSKIGTCKEEASREAIAGYFCVLRGSTFCIAYILVQLILTKSPEGQSICKG